jgi:hypothetical protein
MEYAIAKRHPLIGQQLALPECGDLPAVGSPDSENCLKLGIPRPENVEPGRLIIYIDFFNNLNYYIVGLNKMLLSESL